MLRDFCTRVIHMCDYAEDACAAKLVDITLLQKVAKELKREAVGVSKAVGR